MRFTILFTLLISSAVVAKEASPPPPSVSEAFGHLVGKNLETIGVELDIDLVIKGLRNAASGEDSSLTETQCIELISKAQQEVF